MFVKPSIFFLPRVSVLKKKKDKTLPFGSEGCKRFCILKQRLNYFLPLFEKKPCCLSHDGINKRVSYILGENLNQGNGLNAGVSGSEC